MVTPEHYLNSKQLPIISTFIREEIDGVTIGNPEYYELNAKQLEKIELKLLDEQGMPMKMKEGFAYLLLSIKRRENYH